MRERIEVNRPAYTNGLWYQHLRCVLVPESITEPFDSWWAKIVRNAEEFALPRALFGRAVQLLPDSGYYICSNHEREGHVFEGQFFFVMSHSFPRFHDMK